MRANELEAVRTAIQRWTEAEGKDFATEFRAATKMPQLIALSLQIGVSSDLLQEFYSQTVDGQ